MIICILGGGQATQLLKNMRAVNMGLEIPL